MARDDILHVLWRRRRVFLLTFVVTFATVAFVTSRLPKVYESTAYLLVSPAQAPASSYEFAQVSDTLTKTYGQLLQTARLAQDVQAWANGHIAPNLAGGKIGDHLKVDVGDTQLIALTGDGRTPREAQGVANAYATVFTQRSASANARTPTAGKVTVAEYASLPSAAARPRPVLYLAIGFVLAALAAAAVALLRHRLDQRLDIRDEDTEVLGLSILARIPDQRRAGSDALAGAEGDGVSGRDRRAAEAFRLLLANLAFANLGERPRSVAVVSSGEQEGKSTTALSVARAAAEIGIDTLLVDGDLRRPSLAQKLGLPPQRLGLSAFLLGGRGSIEKVAAPLKGSSLRVLTSGPVPPNPAALLGTAAFDELVEQARERHDFTIFDTPPLAVAADASLIAAHVDGVIFVVDARRTKRNAAAQAVQQLRRSGTTVLGVVVNRTRGGLSEAAYYGPLEPGAAAGTGAGDVGDRDGDGDAPPETGGNGSARRQRRASNVPG